MTPSLKDIIELKTNLTNIDRRLTTMEIDSKNLLPTVITIQSDLKNLIETMRIHVHEGDRLLQKFNERLELLENKQNILDKKMENLGVKIGGILTVSTICISWVVNRFKL